ncbi:hypothetical protein BVH03_12605 [Pseudomonas sp. PA15(2017)]|nr:hypothetical protein BVH03_12605 [Pseudomonas sp. PA15(2017)]
MIKGWTGDYLWERAMPAIFRAYGALPQWIGARLLLPCSCLFMQIQDFEQALRKAAEFKPPFQRRKINPDQHRQT